MTALADRIIDAFPSGSYALAALLRLLDIVETDRIPTAAVECTAQPRLLVNPAFVDRHAGTPETLLMLVLHELHHVLLGHTTLFPRMTEVQNFVFDAVINALLSRLYPDPAHTDLFTRLYADDRFPECLLRPPAGWRPDQRAAIPPGIASLKEYGSRVGDVYQSLYSACGATYDEVYDVLPRLVVEGDCASIPLLGHHGGQQHVSKVIVDVLRRVVEEWGQPPQPIRGRSYADLLRPCDVAPRRERSNRTILRNVIRRIADVERHGSASRRVGVDRIAVATAIPSVDRRAMVQRSLGGQPLLYTATIDDRRRAPRGDRVHVYVDVSGSMEHVRDAVYGAVIDCSNYVQRTIHLFSTRIADVTLQEFRAGVCRTTGGTEIGCVAEHLDEHRIRRAVIITDGFVGRPTGHHLSVLAKARLGICYAGAEAHADDLAHVANVTACFRSGAH